MNRNKSELNFQSAKSRERDGRPIEDLLYQDAKRRQETLQHKRKLFEQQKDEQINATRPAPGSNINTTKYAASKFLKEYMFVCKALFDNDTSEEEGANFSSN